MTEDKPADSPEDGAAQNSREIPESMKIVGYNLLVLVVYTILCKTTNELAGLVMDAFLIGAHVLACLVVAIVKRSGTWFLAAILVLIVGFSTCVGLGNTKI